MIDRCSALRYEVMMAGGKQTLEFGGNRYTVDVLIQEMTFEKEIISTEKNILMFSEQMPLFQGL